MDVHLTAGQKAFVRQAIESGRPEREEDAARRVADDCEDSSAGYADCAPFAWPFRGQGKAGRACRARWNLDRKNDGAGKGGSREAMAANRTGLCAFAQLHRASELLAAR